MLHNVLFLKHLNIILTQLFFSIFFYYTVLYHLYNFLLYSNLYTKSCSLNVTVIFKIIFLFTKETLYILLGHNIYNVWFSLLEASSCFRLKSSSFDLYFSTNMALSLYLLVKNWSAFQLEVQFFISHIPEIRIVPIFH